MKEDIMISLCDLSGVMCEPWAEAGHTCYAVDLQHSVRKDKVKQVGAGKIIFTYGDARYWTPPENVNIVFVSCFPTCTDMAGSGAQDYSKKNGRIPKKGIPQLCDGLLLFNYCHLAAKWSGAPFLVENPSGVIPTHFRESNYRFHPWQYSDEYPKLTCLWTGNGFVMPPKTATEEPEGMKQKIWLMSPGDDRANKRSETPKGFARAVFEANKPVGGAKPSKPTGVLDRFNRVICEGDTVIARDFLFERYEYNNGDQDPSEVFSDVVSTVVFIKGAFCLQEQEIPLFAIEEKKLEIIKNAS